MLLSINNDSVSKNYKLKKPWAEKYRPHKFENLILNPSLEIKFKEILKKNEVPNMILTGYPGSGKTSTVFCLTKKIINNNFDDNYLEFNASDNRGLDIIKNRIYSFCRRKTNNNYLKIVILDEADNLTKKAQSTISNFMEEYKNTTRFLFTCNSNNNIIESIQSKCFLVNFSKFILFFLVMKCNA